jgi:DNA-3-methyladenine glycosylase I
VSVTERSGVVAGADGVERCWWCLGAPEYVEYHDRDWGRPVHDDRRLFEIVTLEAFQSGLSWLTILRKRESFRRAFADFEIESVADFGAADIARLLGDAGIVRHRGKIEATIANAAAARALHADGVSLDELLWHFAPQTERPAPAGADDLAPSTPESTAMAKELKGRGFRFDGPTTAYSLMQAAGLVNDHHYGCAFRD